MPLNSKSKGKRGELELVHWLKDHGIEAERGVQYSGSPGSPDIKAKGLEWLHFEVKRVEKLNIDRAMAQAERDSGHLGTPSVWHRKNQGEWMVTLWAEDFLDLIPKPPELAGHSTNHDPEKG